ncbi:CDP-alcohol phosphatidyltransferase family protein [Flavobacterium sp. SM2513]|uniref:CDP-alcohol phosphatidyltransferase family protein n=1 Tax=Flavobacterium sp. SM2513 TaxID=3424766 RepID=UPI003D7FFCBE
MALIIARFFIGIIIVILSCVEVEYYKTIVISLLAIGVLTDVFDGIIARRLNVSTQSLRRWDSTVDQLFFISVIAATYLKYPEFYEVHWVKIALLVGIELLTYLVSFLKFKKEIATHSIGAKIWTLFLFATLVDVIIEGNSTVLFELFFWIGMLTRLEIISIILILKTWANDVPTFVHALKLRQGKPIKRNRLFNG